jgi:hypothetical protein
MFVFNTILGLNVEEDEACNIFPSNKTPRPRFGDICSMI